MRSPLHDRVNLKPAERARFRAIARRFGCRPSEPAVVAMFGWTHRARIVFYLHLTWAALLLPLGLAVTAVAVLTSWPIGLLGLGPIVVGQLALFEIVKARLIRRGLRTQSQHQRT